MSFIIPWQLPGLSEYFFFTFNSLIFFLFSVLLNKWEKILVKIGENIQHIEVYESPKNDMSLDQTTTIDRLRRRRRSDRRRRRRRQAKLLRPWSTSISWTRTRTARTLWPSCR